MAKKKTDGDKPSQNVVELNAVNTIKLDIGGAFGAEDDFDAGQIGSEHTEDEQLNQVLIEGWGASELAMENHVGQKSSEMVLVEDEDGLTDGRMEVVRTAVTFDRHAVGLSLLQIKFTNSKLLSVTKFKPDVEGNAKEHALQILNKVIASSKKFPANRP